jgi:hypothetical protein
MASKASIIHEVGYASTLHDQLLRIKIIPPKRPIGLAPRPSANNGFGSHLQHESHRFYTSTKAFYGVKLQKALLQRRSLTYAVLTAIQSLHIKAVVIINQTNQRPSPAFQERSALQERHRSSFKAVLFKTGNVIQRVIAYVVKHRPSFRRIFTSKALSSFMANLSLKAFIAFQVYVPSLRASESTLQGLSLSLKVITVVHDESATQSRHLRSVGLQLQRGR